MRERNPNRFCFTRTWNNAAFHSNTAYSIADHQLIHPIPFIPCALGMITNADSLSQHAFLHTMLLLLFLVATPNPNLWRESFDETPVPFHVSRKAKNNGQRSSFSREEGRDERAGVWTPRTSKHRVGGVKAKILNADADSNIFVFKAEALHSIIVKVSASASVVSVDTQVHSRIGPVCRGRVPQREVVPVGFLPSFPSLCCTYSS